MRFLLKAAAFAVVMLLVPVSASAAPGCTDAEVLGPKLISNICWSCFFPIRVSGTPIGGSNSGVPSEAYSSPVCLCDGAGGIPTPGFTMSMWEPSRLIELQRVPGCSSVLNGATLGFDRTNQGSHGSSMGGDNDRQMFTHYHYYAFPLMAMLDLFSVPSCDKGGMVDLDLMYVSELDPTWQSSILSFFTNPEAAAVANPAAQAACTADAIAATAGKPIESMFWCAGSWGSIYPFSGHTTGKTLMQATSLYATRAIASLHRRGMARKSVGKDAICGDQFAPMIPKGQYKINTFHLNPETKNSHAIGESSMFWGSGRMMPGVSDPIYMIWQWNDCCVNL